jgi:hypothetical protein
MLSCGPTVPTVDVLFMNLCTFGCGDFSTYLSNYLNCIFKDFIQYLHAIQYTPFSFFAAFFLLI